MVIPNTHLNEVAKAMAGESFSVPTYNAFSSTLTTVDVTDTTMSGEYGSRVALTAARDNNEVTYTSFKIGTLVPTSGESILGLASFTAATGGTLMTETVIPTINHTNAFDIEFITTITYDRQ